MRKSCSDRSRPAPTVQFDQGFDKGVHGIEHASLKEQIPAGTYGRQLPSVEHEEPPQRVMPYEEQAPCHVTGKKDFTSEKIDLIGIRHGKGQESVCPDSGLVQFLDLFCPKFIMDNA